MSHKYAAPWKAGKASLPPQPTYGQAKEPAEVDAKPNASPELKGVRNWTESVGGIPADRIRDCIIYQLDVKKDQWWIKNATRAYVRRNVQKLVDETPEDYAWSADPLYGTYTLHLDGETYSGTRLRRDPRTPEERQQVREKDGGRMVDDTVKRLAKKDCQTCRGGGYIEVSSYPGDPIYHRLTETHVCRCVSE